MIVLYSRKILKNDRFVKYANYVAFASEPRRQYKIVMLKP